MTHDEFDEILSRRLAAVRETLASKAGEYATGDDRLHNFDRAAEILRCRPEDACLGFTTKHLVGVVDMVKSPEAPTRERIDEKIGDAINYLILLEAILVESIPE